MGGGDGASAARHRRDFLKAGGLALVGLAAAAQLGDGSDETGDDRTPGRRLGMVIDLDRCVGCKSCMVACKAENGVRIGGFRTWVSEREAGAYPSVGRHFLPRMCNHCQDPACLRVCPVGATYKRDDGLVAIDKERCIGCRYCITACPYGARYFNPRPDPEEESRFPARTRGTVDKCDLCAHRIDNGVAPACVNTCPAGARIFGDLNDPESEVGRLSREPAVRPLLPEYGTGPSVLYRGGEPEVFLGDEDGA